MKIGQWRIGRGSYGQMGGFILGSRRENHFQTGPPPHCKHGGGNNLMVWGCMGWNGVGKLTEVQGIMDAQKYCDILDDGVVEVLRSWRYQRRRGRLKLAYLIILPNH